MCLCSTSTNATNATQLKYKKAINFSLHTHAYTAFNTFQLKLGGENKSTRRIQFQLLKLTFEWCNIRKPRHKYIINHIIY